MIGFIGKINTARLFAVVVVSVVAGDFVFSYAVTGAMILVPFDADVIAAVVVIVAMIVIAATLLLKSS